MREMRTQGLSEGDENIMRKRPLGKILNIYSGHQCSRVHTIRL